jgi:hypothetical protein
VSGNGHGSVIAIASVNKNEKTKNENNKQGGRVCYLHTDGPGVAHHGHSCERTNPNGFLSWAGRLPPSSCGLL